MRKLLIAFMLVLTLGCAPTPMAPQNVAEKAMNASDISYAMIPDVEKTIERSDLAIHRFRTQSWDKLRELFTEKTKKYLTDDIMLDVWKKDFSPSGAFEKIVYRLPIVQNNALRIQSLVKFENNYIQFTISSASSGKLDGIFEMPIKLEAIKACPEDCTAEALQLFDMFRARKWTEFTAMSDARLLQKLDAAKLDEMRNDTEKLGRFISAANILPGEKPRTIVYSTVFEKGTLSLSYEFTEDAKLLSFYYKLKLSNLTSQASEEPECPPDLHAPTASEKWEERAVTVAANAEMPNKGLLTLPMNVEKPAVVILVHGSGCNDMNEELLSNHPFMDIAHGLADRGIAVLRYNKRCFEYADKIGTDLTGAVEPHILDDLDAAISMMQKDERVNGSKIFVLGHSLGGYLLPYIATKHPELAGGIVMAGSLRGLEDGLYAQLEDALKEAKATLVNADALKDQEDQMNAEYQELKNIGSDTPDDKLLLSIPAKFWKSVRPTQGAQHIANVKQPLLVLQGEKDVQVYPQHEYSAWQEAAKSQSNIECHLIPNVNHLFMTSKAEGPERSKYINEYATPAHVVPEVLDLIADFIKHK